MLKRGVIRWEWDPSLRYEIKRTRHNFLAITDKNINFILYQFQNRNLKHHFVNATQTFEIDIEQNLHFC